MAARWTATRSAANQAGLTQGLPTTPSQLPGLQVPAQARTRPRSAILDDFFQAAFGGSFLNHQWLIAAADTGLPPGTPWTAPDGLHSIIDADGFPANYPPVAPPTRTGLRDAVLTGSCREA